MITGNEPLLIDHQNKCTIDCRSFSDLPNELLDEVFWYIMENNWGSRSITATVYPKNRGVSSPKDSAGKRPRILIGFCVVS